MKKPLINADRKKVDFLLDEIESKNLFVQVENMYVKKQILNIELNVNGYVYYLEIDLKNNNNENGKTDLYE